MSVELLVWISWSFTISSCGVKEVVEVDVDEDVDKLFVSLVMASCSIRVRFLLWKKVCGAADGPNLLLLASPMIIYRLYRDEKRQKR